MNEERKENFHDNKFSSMVYPTSKEENKGEEFDLFSPLEVPNQEGVNNRRKSAQAASSFSSSYYSSSSSEEEKHVEFDERDSNESENQVRGGNFRKSILKSQFLTNKRESKFQSSIMDKSNLVPQTRTSGTFRKIKTEVEGRLPIRRPSVVQPTLSK